AVGEHDASDVPAQDRGDRGGEGRTIGDEEEAEIDGAAELAVRACEAREQAGSPGRVGAEVEDEVADDERAARAMEEHDFTEDAEAVDGVRDEVVTPGGRDAGFESGAVREVGALLGQSRREVEARGGETS